MHSRAIPKVLSLVLAAAGGFFTDWAFPDHNLWFLAICGLAVLAVALLRDHAGWNFIVGWVWGIGFFLPHLQWAQYAVGGNLPWVVLSLVEALFVGLFAVVWTFTRRITWVGEKLWAGALAFAVLWVGVESLRSAVPWGGLPWGRIGFSQSDSPLVRIAWLAGVPGISFAVAALAFLLAGALLGVLALNMWQAGLSSATLVAIIVATFAIPLNGQAEDGTLTVGAVQGNVANPGRDAFMNQREVLNNHVAGTLALADHSNADSLDVVVWPENGTDIDPQEDADARALIDDAAAKVGVPVLLGAQEYPVSGGRYNVSLLWQAGEGVLGRYAKQRPVPFAEYIPARDFFAKIYPGVDAISIDMIAGSEPAAMSIPVPRLGRDVVVGPIICFEVAVDDVVHDSIDHGAQVLFVQTNNASFGPTSESTQQLAMSRIRAVETGRAVVHVSTVGVSAVYSPTGVEYDRTEHFEAAQMLETVNLRDSVTPSVAMGQWPTRAFWAGSVLLLVAGLFASRRSRA